MKKLLLFLSVAVSSVFFCLCAAAAEPAVIYEAPFLSDTVIFDGEIDDAYLAATPIPIASPLPNASTEGRSSGVAYIIYDDIFLYVAVDVEDTTPCPPAWTNGSGVSSYDGILFGFNFTGGPASVSYDGKNAGYRQYNLTGRGSADARHHIEYDADGNQTGYTIEMRLPWPGDYPIYTLQNGMVSFAIWLYDYAWDGSNATGFGYLMTHASQQNAYSYSPGFPTGNAVEGAWDGLNLCSRGLLTVRAGEEGVKTDGLADEAYRYATAGGIGAKATYRSAWDGTALHLLCEVSDTTRDAQDAVTFCIDWDRVGGALAADGRNGSVTVTRAGEISFSGSAVTAGSVDGFAVETGDGYCVEVVMPLGDGVTGEKDSRFFLGAVSVRDGETVYPEGGVDPADSSRYETFCLTAAVYDLRIIENGKIIKAYDGIPESSKIVLPEPAAQDGRVILGWLSDGGQLYAPGAAVTVGAGSATFTLHTVGLRALPGASVRLTDDDGAGLRFAAAVSKADYDFLCEHAADVRVGALMVPAEEAGNTVMTHWTLQAAGIRFCDVTDTGFVPGIGEESEYGWYAAAQNIALKHSADDFVFLPYLSYRDGTGNEVIIYAGNTASASVYGTAYPAYEDRDASYSHPTPEGVNSPYDDGARLCLKSWLDRTYVIGPNIDGSFGAVIPGSIGEANCYAPSYGAAVRGDTLTLYVASPDLLDGVEQVVFCGRKFPLTHRDGETEIDITVGDAFETIRVNQVGYRCDAVKRAIVTDGGNYFWLIGADTGEIVYAGAVEPGSYEKLADEVVNYCDFSDFETPGTYYLLINADMEHFSYPFAIGDDIYNDIAALTLKCFYYNRCGCAVNGEWDGANHPACHTGNAYVLEFTGETDDSGAIHYTSETGETVTDVTGGWHDAGDFGRYTTWEAPSVSKMMIAYRLRPTLFGDDTGIPESGNGVPDILDEAYYTLSWLLKLQRADGAVYHKLTSAQHAGFVLPQDDHNQFYLFPVSVEASASFAGAMGMAARVYREIDAAFADRCLDAAKRAYLWAKENAAILGSYPTKDGSGTGIGSSPNVYSELFFAAESLWQTTGEQAYYDDCAAFTESASKVNEASYLCAVYDMTVGDTGRTVPDSMLSLQRERYDIMIGKEEDKFRSTAYEFSLTTGSYANQNLMGCDAAILLGDLLNGNEAHRLLVEENANYVLGKNATGYCGVLGVGTQQILHPHLRFPTPGWVTGGACDYAILKTRFERYLVNQTTINENTPPLKCYLDEMEYFYINEPTISSNANALLTFTLLSDAEP